MCSRLASGTGIPDSPCARGNPAQRQRSGVCAGLPHRRPSAATRAESATEVTVYRLVQWLSRNGQLWPGDARPREAIVGGTTVAVGRLQDAPLRVHARAAAGLWGHRGGARAAHPRAAARGARGEADAAHRASVAAAADVAAVASPARRRPPPPASPRPRRRRRPRPTRRTGWPRTSRTARDTGTGTTRATRRGTPRARRAEPRPGPRAGTGPHMATPTGDLPARAAGSTRSTRTGLARR